MYPAVRSATHEYPSTLVHPALIITAIALDAASAILLLYWSVALIRLITTSIRIPTARRGIALAAAHPPTRSVCIVIPAHNEEISIRPLLDSLRAQDYPRLNIVLALDRCTDRTAELARSLTANDPRFSILEINSCPDDWAGKVNAVWQGVNSPAAQSADLLLFADADTIFHPSCVTATAALLEHRRLDLLSLLSTLTCHRWFEYIVQPAAGLELVRQYPIGRANRPTAVGGSGRRAFANGQFMMFTREAYCAIGGHAAVHSELLEDLALARNIANAGRPAGLFLADGILTCRMYESWPQFREGWKRIYIESAKRKVKRLKQAAAVSGLFGGILPMLALAALVISLLAVGSLSNDHGLRPDQLASFRVGLYLSIAGLIAWLALVAAVHRIGRVPLWTAPAFALGSLFTARILSEAARDLRSGIPTRWAGRDYIRTPR